MILQYPGHDKSSNRRPQTSRRPIVENLEGRQLLSGFGSVPDPMKVYQAAVVIERAHFNAGSHIHHIVRDVQSFRQA